MSAGQLFLALDGESDSGSSACLLLSSVPQLLVTQPSHGEWRKDRRMSGNMPPPRKSSAHSCARTLPPTCCWPNKSGSQTRHQRDQGMSTAHSRQALHSHLTMGSRGILAQGGRGELGVVVRPSLDVLY